MCVCTVDTVQCVLNSTIALMEDYACSVVDISFVLVHGVVA